MILDRLEITGPLDDNTPLVVIEEILCSHGVEYQKIYLQDRRYVNTVLDQIQTCPKISLELPLCKRSKSLVAGYISQAGHTWTESRLLEALNYLQGYCTSIEIPLNFVVGPQTPNLPMSLNACVLYKLSRAHGLSVYRETTMDEMATNLRLLVNSHEELVGKVQGYIQFLTKPELINILSKRPRTNNGPTDVVTTDGLIEAYIEIGISNIERIIPRTNNESVLLAAINYQIDISASTIPYREYMNLKTTREHYRPLEESMSIAYGFNSIMFNLKYTFSPLFPIDCYTESQLKFLCQLEGIPVEGPGVFGGLESWYENLQIAYCSKNFYPGVWPCMDSMITKIDLDLVPSINPTDIVCYGIRDESVTAYKWSELLDMFTTVRKFNDCAGQPFENIKKLKNLCIQKFPEQYFSKDCMGIRDKLYQVISSIEFDAIAVDAKVKKLVSVFPSEPDKIRDVLQHIFNLGMTMRGWQGPPYDYPIQDAPIYDQLVIDQKVTNGFILLEKLLSGLSTDVRKVILDLPLMKYNSGVFQASVDRVEGITIFDRLELVKAGENTNSILSCIRMSSNWIIHSTYYYLQAISETPKFNIADLIYTT